VNEKLDERLTTGHDGVIVNIEPEKKIVADMLWRGIKVAPAWLVLSFLIFGIDGVASGAYGIALVFANFIAAAGLLTWAGRISPGALMFAALGGFILRLAVLTVAVIAASKISVFAPVPLGITIIVSHLGLLVWETRYVSLSLAYPGLGPARLAQKQRKETK
jgi:hypothetical protein